MLHQRQPAWTVPAVIVATGDGDTRYLDATSEAAFHRSALSLLRERFAAGYYREVEPEESAPPVELDDETVAGLDPGSEVIRLHEQQVSARNRWLQERSAYYRWRQRALSALEREDGALAWQCLKRRSGYEYEGVRLERIEGYDPGTEESRRRLLDAVASKVSAAASDPDDPMTDEEMFRQLLPFLGLRFREMTIEEVSPATFADLQGQAVVFPIEHVGQSLRLVVKLRLAQLTAARASRQAAESHQAGEGRV